jgi:hypothetical protein
MADADPQPALKQAMTSRLVVMMTPAEKQAIESRAQALDLTPSELVRRAAQTYQPSGEADALDILAEELGKAVTAMRKDMKSAFRTLDAHKAEMARLKKSTA